jgi:hypothetical protein
MMLLRFFLPFALFAAACGGDSGNDDAGPVGGMGDLVFMSECDLANDLCDGSLSPPLYCRMYNDKGISRCTHECSTNADCAAPSPGCNMMGVCKAP